MYNPLAIFTGAALVTLAALLGVTYDKWSGTIPDQVSVAESELKSAPEGKLQDMAPPAAAEGPAAEKTELASVAPEEPASPVPSPDETATDVQKGSEVSEEPGPTFDTIRIERDGSAVIAGRGLPESDVTVMLNGSPLGSVKADLEGAWVFVPEEPVPPGDHQLTLRMTRPGTLSVDSEQSVALKVPERLGDEALVVLSDANRPSRVLQKPTTSENETTVAKSETKPSVEQPQGDMPATMDLTLGTVDYDDAGQIIFSGQSEPGANVRLYVDNRAVGDAPVGADGKWSFAGNEAIAPGSHSLRVDQLQADGSVSKRIELPFVRATPQDVASLNEPAGSATEESSKVEDEATAIGGSSEPTASESETGNSSTEEPPPAASGDEPPASGPAAVEETQIAETGDVENSTETLPPAAEPPAQMATNMTDDPSVSSADASSAPTPSAGAPDPAEASLPRNGKIVIQPGNSLWRISRVIYGRGIEYTVIYEANRDHIRDPNLIYPGQIFATPGVLPPETIDPKATSPLANTTSSPTSPQ
jgi:nucleoid-associated protein YgaU